MNAVFKFSIVILFFCLSSFSAQTLRSAAEPDYPPLSMVTPEGGSDGFAVDLLRAATRAMGLEITFQTASWNQIKGELAAGELDVLPLVGRTPERESLYDFTVPYLTLHGALFIRNDEPVIKNLSDLTGKRIAVMKGDNAEEYVLRANLSDDIVSTATFEDAFRLLAAGDADAVIAPKLMGVSLLKNLGISTIRVIGHPNHEFKQDFCFAVQKGNADLLAGLNEGLSIINANGVAENVYQKWIGSAKYESETSRTLLYGGDNAYPPFEFLDEKGHPSGFNIDLMRALAKDLGVEVSFHLLPWSEIRQKMCDGELDLSSMLYSEGRDREVDYSAPLLASSQAVFARKDSPPYQNIDDLKACRVSVQDGDLAHDFAVEQGLGKNLVVTASPQEALRLLADGEVDFSLSALLQGQYWIHHDGWKNLRVAEPRLFVTDYCYAVPEGREDLVNLVNAGLAELKQTGTYRAIYNEWLGPLDPAFKWEKISKWIGIAIAVVGLSWLLVALWIYLLQQQVRKKTAELRQSEERFNIAADAATLGVWEFDILTEQLVWDHRMFLLYGISTEKFTGTYETWHRGLHPEDRQRAMDEVAAAASGKKPFNTEFRIIRPDGEIRYIRAISNVIRNKTGAPLRMIGINYDITELINARQALQEGEEKYRALFENAPLPYQSLNNEGCFIDINPTWLRILGYDRDEVIGKPFSSFLHPDFVPQFETNFPAFKKRGTVSGVHFKIRRKDGAYRDIQFEGCIGYLPDGSFRQTYCVFQDITERLEAERKLLKSKEEFRNLAESMPQIVWITRPDGWNIYFNQQWVDYTGLTLEESYGKGWNKPFHPDDRQRALDAWEQAIQNNGSYSLECRLRRFDGTYRWWLIRGVPQRNAVGETVKWFGTCTDIEQIKHAENELAEQLEELHRWREVMTGRENRVIEIKTEVNELLSRLGEPPRYASVTGKEYGG